MALHRRCRKAVAEFPGAGKKWNVDKKVEQFVLKFNLFEPNLFVGLVLVPKKSLNRRGSALLVLGKSSFNDRPE
jgi:hypothetical protein